MADEPARQGIGLTLIDFSPDTRDQIERFIDAHEGDMREADLQPAADDEAPCVSGGEAAVDGEVAAQTRHERVRGLSSTEQLKLVPSQTAYPQATRSAARRLLAR